MNLYSLLVLCFFVSGLQEPSGEASCSNRGCKWLWNMCLDMKRGTPCANPMITEGGTSKVETTNSQAMDVTSAKDVETTTNVDDENVNDDITQSTTKSSSFSINPISRKMTSVETGNRYSTSKGTVSTSALENSSTSELSSGGTKPAEGTMSTTILKSTQTVGSISTSEETDTAGSQEQGSTTQVMSTVTKSYPELPSYGTSSSVVSSTSSASSKAQNGLSTSSITMTSTSPGTDTTSISETDTLSTGTIGIRTRTTVESSSAEIENSQSTTVSPLTSTTESLSTKTTVSLSDDSSESTPTPLSTKTSFKNEIWNMNPGEFIPIEGITIFLCPEITTTTKLPTSSFTINPVSHKVTSEEKGTTYSTSEGSTSTLKLESTTTIESSSGGTKTSETDSQSSSKVIPTTVSTGASTWYGSSSSTVFSTSTGSSKASTGSSTSITSMASTNPGTGTTSRSEIEIRSTGTTETQTSTPTSEASTTSKLTSSPPTDSTLARSTVPTTSASSQESASSSVASFSTASTENEMTSRTTAPPTPMHSIGSTTSGTVMTSVSTLSSSTSVDSEELTYIGETTPLGIDRTVQSTQTPQTSSGAHETDGTLKTATEETTTETNELSTASFEEETPLSSTGSTDLSDPISFTSSSYSDVSVSTTTQKTTPTVSSEESSSSAVIFSTESNAITAHENVGSSVSTVTSMEGNTENTETSTTQMLSSRPVEVTDNTEVSSIQTELSSFSSSLTGVAVTSSKPENRSPTTSPAKTEETKLDVKTSTFFRSETAEESTTDSPSSSSAVPDSVESTTKVTSTSRKSQPTTSGIEFSKESTQPTVVEPINSSSTTVDTNALTSSAPYSESTSSTNEAPSISKTTTGVLDSSLTTVPQAESTQDTDTTTFATTPEAATTATESSTVTTSAKALSTSQNWIMKTTSSSPSKSTAGQVETIFPPNSESNSATTSKNLASSSADRTTLSSTPARPSTANVVSTTKSSSSPTVASSSTISLTKSKPAETGRTTPESTTTSKIESSTTSKTGTPTSAKLTTKSTHTAPPLPSQSQTSSSASLPSEQSTSFGTSSLSTPSTSRQSTPLTTHDRLCKQQCPQGYLVGSSLCFQLVPASSKINSYQSALSYCKTTDRQTLASLDKIRDNSDIKIIQESAGLQNIDWIYANGIGSKQERFLKTASVYSIFSQSLVSSPILKNVGISELFGNVSALCVLPQYCNSTECDVEKLFLVYEYYNAFKQTAGTLQPKQQGDVTCLYGNQKSTKVTCNSLGAIYPNPSNIDCEESAAERKIIDTTNQTVSSCKECFGRGTRECQEVLGENGNVEGYRCVCQEPFTMASCWRTENPCNSSYCGANGKCVSELGDVSCECNWGFTGDKCETRLAEKFNGDFGYSSAVGATITLGGILLRVLKVALMGFTLSNEQGDDPQDTHQRLRTYLMTGAGVIMCFYSNPTLLAISPSACRFYYVAIHFCYMMAMLQWLFEGWNVNQVLRCVHLNQWEIDWQGNRSWGVRIAPRMILSFLLTGTFLLITFQTGWNKLAASWTCVGVICQETLNIWIPVFSAVLIIVLFGGTVYESSIMIKYRRPLLGYKIDMKIERELGREVGRRVQKCRENDSLSIIGLLLLVAQYISVIYSSDKRDEPLYGYITVVLSGIYSTFCSYQEIITCPEDRADFYKRLQRWFPVRFAPDYNPETMWTLPEVKEFYSVPKAEREARYENFLSRNEKLYIHHRWDVRINQIFLENKEEFKINDALVQIWHEEMRDLKAKNGTEAQKYVIQGVYADYMDTVPDKDPRDAGKLKGRLELVTLAAEDDKNGVRLAKFFIVPTFHTFTPEMPDSSHTPQNEIIRDHERRLMAQLDTDIYELTREASEEQKTFVNSAIVFWNYGNKVVR